MKNKKGFTLVELLAVIAILAILVIMALPAVLRMFNSARRDSFTNEVNTVLRTSRQQYLLSGGQDTEWSNAEGSTKILSLTGNSNLRYYVKMNNEGKIIKLQVTNGDFQYNVTNNVGIDIAESSDVQAVSELESGDVLVIAITPPIIFVNRQNSGSITIGDEVALDTEHFLVVSSDSAETVLLSKYDLKQVGSDYIQDASGTNADILKVTLLDSNNVVYWDNANCRFNVSWSCGAAGLKSEYANSTNPAGKTGTYAEPRPYVYDENAVNIYPVINAYMDKIGSTSEINVSGRLLSYEEAKVLDRNITKDMNNYNYWSGSAESYDTAYTISYYGYTDSDYANAPRSIRPVIVISTSDMPK